jgi:hypothetical protein
VSIIKSVKIALPEALERFQDAAMAAQVKGNCYHCRHVHYAKVHAR